MSERLTDQQLKARGLVLAEMVQQEATIAALRARVAKLEAAQEEAKTYWQAWAAKRLEISRTYWLRAAKRALAGDLRELQNRVDLIEADPVDVVLSDAALKDAPQ